MSADAIAAFEAIFNLTHKLTDATRLLAQREVANRVETRIFRGRKQQTDNTPDRRPVDGKDYMVLLEEEVTPEYHLGGELSSVMSNVRMDIYSIIPDRVEEIWENARKAITSLSGTITLRDGVTVFIAGCTLEPGSGQLDPDEPEDASDEFLYIFRGVWRVTYDQATPAGLA